MDDHVTIGELNPGRRIDDDTLTEVETLIRKVIADTYPADVAAVAADKTVGDGRLARLAATRTLFGAWKDGQLVGVAAVHLSDDGDTPVGYLSTCFVARRRQGIGRRLTAQRARWAVEHGAAALTATTHPWNTASAANLTAAGFEPDGETPDEWLGHGTIVSYRQNRPHDHT